VVQEAVSVEREKKAAFTLLKKAPNGVLIIGGVLLSIVVICVTVLAIEGKSPAGLFGLVNVIFNGLGILAGTGAFVYAGSAAKNAQTAVAQTNGELTQRIQDTVRVALELHDVEVHGMPPRKV